MLLPPCVFSPIGWMTGSPGKGKETRLTGDSPHNRVPITLWLTARVLLPRSMAPSAMVPYPGGYLWVATSAAAWEGRGPEKKEISPLPHGPQQWLQGVIGHSHWI